MKYSMIPTINPMNPKKSISESILSFYRGSKCFFKSPMFESPMYKSSVSFKRFSPVSQEHSLSIVSNLPNKISVSALNKRGRPTTIFLAIVSIVIYTVYLSLFLSVSFNMLKVRLIHIISEFFKGFPKALYATTSIKVITDMWRPITSIPQIPVSLIKTCFPHSMIVGRQLSPYTVAGGSLTRFVNDILCTKHLSFFTFALKKPITFTSICSHKLNRCQLSKLLSSNILHIVLPLQARRIGRSVPEVAPMLLMS